jgi:hypothetical protein
MHVQRKSSVCIQRLAGALIEARVHSTRELFQNNGEKVVVGNFGCDLGSSIAVAVATTDVCAIAAAGQGLQAIYDMQSRL